MEDGLLARRVQERELQRLGHERQPEVEVEDVGAREQSRERAPLRELLSREAAAAVERPVRLGWRSSRLKTTSRASTPLRRSASTFCHGMPAKFTGQCVTGLTPLVPLELVEVAERRPAGTHARRVRGELLVGDLAERALDAEVRDVQILLVDDRRDARVDLDDVLADELDVEEVLDLERRDDPLGELHQRVVRERDEVHRQAGAHRLARLRVAEHDAASVGDAVDRALASLGELHHEQLRLVLAEQLDELLEAQRLGDARAVREQLRRGGPRSADRILKPREPEEKIGFTATSRSG